MATLAEHLQSLPNLAEAADAFLAAADRFAPMNEPADALGDGSQQTFKGLDRFARLNGPADVQSDPAILAELYRKRGAWARAGQALIDDPATFDRLDDDRSAVVQTAFGALSRLGRFRDALSLIDRLAAVANGDPTSHYVAAGCLARIAASTDQSASEGQNLSSDERNQCGQRACGELRAALDNGLHEVQQKAIATQPDFQFFRDRPEFQHLFPPPAPPAGSPDG